MSAFLLSLAVRVLLALLQRTPFQPDETYQSLEPAHRLVFGYGHATWEWRPNPAIEGVSWGWLGESTVRGGGWVAFWAGVYRVLALCGANADVLVRELEGCFVARSGPDHRKRPRDRSSHRS